VLSILSGWLIQFCLYLDLKSCIPEICSSLSLPQMSTPCRGGGGGLGTSITLRAMPAGTYVPGRASQAGQAVRQKSK
jgi:hypothetical protein